MAGASPDWVIADEELFRYMNNLERQVGGYLWGGRMYENNQAGLVDEIQLFVQPILLGAGRSNYPVLNEAVRLKLIETHTFHSGIVYLRYQR